MSTLTVMRDLVQRSDDWLAARCGLVTASVVGALVTSRPLGAMEYDCPECSSLAGFPCLSKTRGYGEIKTLHAGRHAAAREADSAPVLDVADDDTSRGILLSLAAERVTGHVEETPMTSAMWRGLLEEPLAREKYAEHHAAVSEVGFMVRDFGGYSLGFSPDGLVGDDGLIEIKSRGQKAQMRTVIDDAVPASNMAQLQAGLLVSGRKWIDYVSYSGGMALWVKRVYPDPAWQSAIQAAVKHAEGRIDDLAERYESAVEGLPMTERTPDLYAEPVIQMDEFGETPSIYVWPKDHEEGDPFPDDFYNRVSEGLQSVGIAWEPV